MSAHGRKSPSRDQSARLEHLRVVRIAASTELVIARLCYQEHDSRTDLADAVLDVATRVSTGDRRTSATTSANEPPIPAIVPHRTDSDTPERLVPCHPGAARTPLEVTAPTPQLGVLQAHTLTQPSDYPFARLYHTPTTNARTSRARRGYSDQPHKTGQLVDEHY
jgi:hypothetical protein